ncbi:UNVERIFIED_CONTAM: hypothetical protein Sradi_4444400 [Sesamum radiatum]|uniref:3'-5' exonuclease domain-containing protein n=1 Tax=Sesamum radiatum TaxID=300843 RepID=A0AAW2NUE9_SESRA
MESICGIHHAPITARRVEFFPPSRIILFFPQLRSLLHFKVLHFLSYTYRTSPPPPPPPPEAASSRDGVQSNTRGGDRHCRPLLALRFPQHLRRHLLWRLRPHNRHPRPRHRHHLDLRNRVHPPPPTQLPHRRPRCRVAPLLQPLHPEPGRDAAALRRPPLPHLSTHPQPLHPPSIVDFLANPRYTFVGIGIEQDLEKLEEDYELGFNTRTVDLRSLAAAEYGRRELKNAGLKQLASLVLEKEVEKPKRVTMSRWDNEWLTPTQVQYACIDAFVCFEIGRILNASSASASTSG